MDLSSARLYRSLHFFNYSHLKFENVGNREGAEISAWKFNPYGGHLGSDFIQGLWPNPPLRQFF